MTGRTRPPAATKRTSAFTHAIVVWLRKVLLEWLTRTAGKTHARTGTLFCMGMARCKAALVQEWYYVQLQLSSNNVNGTPRRTPCPALPRLMTNGVASVFAPRARHG